MHRIYLDNAATTPVDKKVFEEMKPYFSDNFGNASSIHNFGRNASEAVEKARKQVADFFGADSGEIIFTSGATESNNLAIKGIVKAHYKKEKAKPHIITTAFEHHCVLNAVKNLEKENLIEATYIKPERDGVINILDIKKAIRPNTILVSVMYVNNEIGTVQPIKGISQMLKKYNSNIIFHTDATQAVNYFDCNVKKLGVDLMSMSAHKIYGPKGVGALYVKKGLNIAKIQDGGEQERGLRAGTLNVPGIVGLGVAMAGIRNYESGIRKIKSLRDYLIKRVLREIPNSKLNGSKIKRSPNNVNFSFPGVEGESLIMMLDADGISASTGSACSSGTLEPSHVLLSIGSKPEEAHSSLRITLGKYTTKKEIDYTIGVLKESINKLRKISGNVLSDYYKLK
ncbi:MAG TPA: cysteine desulfurase family protein [Candidatus Moranbacteria bacterium]|nr:cysteine desulfurase family protein [Candidatus Moranbacteria bacterium]